jgi:peroxiredoxin
MSIKVLSLLRPVIFMLWTGFLSPGKLIAQHAALSVYFEDVQTDLHVKWVDPVTGLWYADTLRMDKQGAFQFRKIDLKTPVEAWVSDLTEQEFPPQNGRHFLVVPGLPLVIRGKLNDPASNVQRSGPGAAFDSLFQTFMQNNLAQYKALAPAADHHQKIREFDSLLVKINKLDLRPVRDYILTQLVNKELRSSQSMLQLNDFYLLARPYLSGIGNPVLRKGIDEEYQKALFVMTRSAEGNPAPDFKLVDPAGKTHRLVDFKGKVIFLDLWASWCLPCRLETRYLQKLHEQYRHRTDMIIISIGVSDQSTDWKKAIHQDKPSWLQLFDRNSVVANAYAVRSLPRFVVIGKSGEIVSFNAPPPSDQHNLIKLLDKQLND